ncbi:Ig-like repeat protein Blp2 [Acinetobacter silvestris]|uniref:BapA prefix-like domain-containing protein n=1 Tax=Acinetobacter silvestris TaxID=1977882 RepID=A0A1Y3CKV9_9GAMM|nr:Ig-like repeat protein Blp2 [Acinetobacter silvestris]OTG66500.1 hypothetical protein B9T28_04425 [Acinetobacter silvestris]
MPRIIVAAKIDKTLLQDTQSKAVILSQPSIIQVGVTKDEVLSIIKEGNNVVITLKNGEKIVLESFFQTTALTEHSLTFPEKDGSFALTHFDNHGTFTNYSGLAQLETLSNPNPIADSANQLEAYQSQPEANFSLANLWSSNSVKAGLGVISAVGLGLLLLDDNGQSSSSPPKLDFMAPDAPTAKLDDTGTMITGTGEVGVTIYVVDGNKNVLATTKVDQSGHYTIELFPALTDGHKVYVNAKDSAGNTSKFTAVTGNKDTIAPEEPQAQLSDDGTVVSGRAETNSVIHVYDADGKLIGMAKANDEGIFSILVSPALTEGKIGTVVSEDSAGNKSKPHEIIAGKDTIAPEVPRVEINKAGTSVKGTAEANAKIEIHDAAGKLIGSGSVDENGQFTITISPALASDQIGKLTAEDAAGNKSNPLEIKAGLDTLAPEKAIAELNAAGNLVTGTAEAHAKVTVYDKDNNLLGTATADADGKYSITLSKALTEKQLGKVYTTDAAGNQSDLTTVMGTKDVTAPAKPTITKVTDDFNNLENQLVEIKSGGTTDDVKPLLSGTAEPDATLTIYDNGKLLGVITVKSGTTPNVDWSFTPNFDLGLGSHSITIIQTDKAGNTSLVSDPFLFTVVAPEPPMVDPTAELMHAFANPASMYALENILDTSDLYGVDDSTIQSDHSEIFQITEMMGNHQINHAQNLDPLIDHVIYNTNADLDNVENKFDQSNEINAQAITRSDSNILSYLMVVTQRDDLLDSLHLNSMIM